MKFIIGCSDVSPDGTEMHSLLSLCKTNPAPDRDYRYGIYLRAAGTAQKLNQFVNFLTRRVSTLALCYQILARHL